MDTTGDGMISFDEFVAVLNDERVRTWLAAMDLTVEHVETLFDLLGGDDGCISQSELISGVARLKGSARSIDMVILLSESKELCTSMRQMDRALVQLEQAVERLIVCPAPQSGQQPLQTLSLDELPSNCFAKPPSSFPVAFMQPDASELD